MKLPINWPAGILSAIAAAVIGIGFFIFVGSKIDSACQPIGYGVGCHAWKAVGVVIGGWSDIWRSIFAPRCVGGGGPDDCLGPDGMIMLITLLVIGFVVGNLIWSKKKSTDHVASNQIKTQ